jgi:hypothetical protein
MIPTIWPVGMSSVTLSTAIILPNCRVTFLNSNIPPNPYFYFFCFAIGLAALLDAAVSVE